MDLKNKLDIENINKAIDFVGIVYPSFESSVDTLKNIQKQLKNSNNLETQDGIGIVLDNYRKFKFPNIDRVLEVVSIISAANHLEKNNKLYFERKERFRKKIQDHIKEKDLFTSQTIIELIGYWKKLGLPNLSSIVKTNLNKTSPTIKHGIKTGNISYKNLDQKYVKNIPEHLHKIVLDQINTLEELTGLNVVFLGPSSSDTTNYNLFPASVHEYIQRTLENLSKLSKSKAVLR